MVWLMSGGEAEEEEEEFVSGSADVSMAVVVMPTGRAVVRFWRGAGGADDGSEAGPGVRWATGVVAGSLITLELASGVETWEDSSALQTTARTPRRQSGR